MYYRLNTLPIDIPFVKQDFTIDLLYQIISDCYTHCAFSTFPYYYEKISSKNSIKKYNSGDCVALSYYVHNRLKSYNIVSYLIPASIPKKYQKSGYLHLSHIALAIPVSSYEIYIIDVSFYFLHPIKINLNDSTRHVIFSKNIYSREFSKNLKDYNSINIIHGYLSQQSNDKIFNKYQTIPNNTYKLDCNFSHDINDKWSYYLIQATNPDKAISNFFLNIKKYPFIVTTEMDDNNICVTKYIVKISDSGLIIKDLDDKQYQLNDEMIDFLDKYFNNQTKKILSDYKYKNPIDIND